LIVSLGVFSFGEGIFLGWTLHLPLLRLGDISENGISSISLKFPLYWFGGYFREFGTVFEAKNLSSIFLKSLKNLE